MKLKLVAFFAVIALGFSSCGESTSTVESGTYQGTIKKVNPEKTEIYVTIEEDKTLELYFTDKTSLTRNGETVMFSELAEGQNVEVEIEKVGKRLEPVSVKILE